MKSRLTAQSITYDTLYKWTIKDYVIRDFKGLRESIRRGSQMDTIIEMEPRDFLISKNDQETLTNEQLKTYINRQKERGVANIKNFEIELESIASSFSLMSNITTMARSSTIENTYDPKNLRMM